MKFFVFRTSKMGSTACPFDGAIEEKTADGKSRWYVNISYLRDLEKFCKKADHDVIISFSYEPELEIYDDWRE